MLAPASLPRILTATGRLDRRQAARDDQTRSPAYRVRVIDEGLRPHRAASGPYDPLRRAELLSSAVHRDISEEIVTGRVGARAAARNLQRAGRDEGTLTLTDARGQSKATTVCPGPREWPEAGRQSVARQTFAGAPEAWMAAARLGGSAARPGGNAACSGTDAARLAGNAACGCRS